MPFKFAQIKNHLRLGSVKNAANVLHTLGSAVADYPVLFCGICGCGRECKFAVPSTGFKCTQESTVLKILAIHVEVLNMVSYLCSVYFHIKLNPTKFNSHNSSNIFILVWIKGELFENNYALP